jgi:hypothetical protein
MSVTMASAFALAQSHSQGDPLVNPPKGSRCVAVSIVFDDDSVFVGGSADNDDDSHIEHAVRAGAGLYGVGSYAELSEITSPFTASLIIPDA